MIVGSIGLWMHERQYVHPKLREILDMMMRTDFTSLQEGKYVHSGTDVYYTVMMLQARDRQQTKAEKHEQYIDIHYLLEGEETIGWACDSGSNIVVDSSPADDYTLYADVQGEQFVDLLPGMYAVLYPTDIHRPGLMSLEEQGSRTLRKVVVKIHKDIFQ